METCEWWVVIGEYDDGEQIIGDCGLPIPDDSHDGLCSVHTRGMSFEEYYAPFGAAWQEEMR